MPMVGSSTRSAHRGTCVARLHDAAGARPPHRNGTVVARWPQVAQLDSQLAVLDAEFAKRLHAVQSDFVGQDPTDGMERLYSYRQLPEHPLSSS